MTSSDEARRGALETFAEREVNAEDWADPIAHELELLWDDLSGARNRAVNGVWSIECEGLVYRIVMLTLATGKPTDWGNVQMPLLLDGTYQGVHEAIDIDAPVDMEHVRRTWESYQARQATP